MLTAALLGVASCKPEPSSVGSQAPTGAQATETSPLSASYRLSGRDVTLRNGRHDEPVAPGSAARNSTTVWGTPLSADLDGDGDADAVVILVNEPGGSGTFYYIAAAEREGNAYRGSAAVLLGDRIAPQSIGFDSGVVTVDYAERRRGEPMSAAPSVGMKQRFTFAAHELRELTSGDAQLTTPR